MKSLFKFVILSLFLLIVSLNFISGFGVSIPYSVGDPLRISSGQSVEVVVGLQSSIDEGDLIIVPEVLTGKEIVEIIDSLQEYNIIPNQPKGAEVHLKINIPEKKYAEKEYLVELGFRDITQREGGMVGFSTSITVSFNILVIDKLEQLELEPPDSLKSLEPPELNGIKETKGAWILFIFGFFLLIFIITMILIIWRIVRNKKNNFEPAGEVESKYYGG